MGLHVRFDKSDVAQTSFFGVGFPGRNKITATIDTHNGSSRADTPGYLNGSFAPSTSNIQDAISGAQHQLGEYFYAVLTKSPNQDVSPGVEFRNEYGVPEIDILAGRLDRNGVAHIWIPFISRRQSAVSACGYPARSNPPKAFRKL